MKMQFGKEGRRFFFLTFCVRGREPLLSRIVANNDRGAAPPEPPAKAGLWIMGSIRVPPLRRCGP